MDIDDDLMDLFEEGSKKTIFEIKLNEWIFPIIGKNCPDTGNPSSGTGFFVNNHGYFVTAGHVLKNKKQTYKAVIKGIEFDFKLVFIEYIDKDKQEPPLCKDLAIGKIDIENEKIISCFFDTNNADGKTLNYSGYKQEPPRIILKRELVYFYNYQATDEKLEEGRRLNNFNGADIIVDKRPICENTRSLKLIEGIHYNGLSGGPVYFEKSIFGMFIGNEYIKSTYIIEKLKQLNISFNT